MLFGSEKSSRRARTLEGGRIVSPKGERFFAGRGAVFLRNVGEIGVSWNVEQRVELRASNLRARSIWVAKIVGNVIPGYVFDALFLAALATSFSLLDFLHLFLSLSLSFFYFLNSSNCNRCEITVRRSLASFFPLHALVKDLSSLFISLSLFSSVNVLSISLENCTFDSSFLAIRLDSEVKDLFQCKQSIFKEKLIKIFCTFLFF